MYNISSIFQEKFVNSAVAFVQCFRTCVRIIFICSAFRCVLTFHIKQIWCPNHHIKNFHTTIYATDIFKFILQSWLWASCTIIFICPICSTLIVHNATIHILKIFWRNQRWSIQMLKLWQYIRRKPQFFGKSENSTFWFV